MQGSPAGVEISVDSRTAHTRFTHACITWGLTVLEAPCANLANNS